MHQPLSSVNNMGRSGTQVVYHGDRKRLLQDEGRHEKNSVKGHRELQQGSWDPHQEESSLWTPGLRKHLLKQYKDPLSLLVETEDRRKRKSSAFYFFANIETTNIFVATSAPERSSRYLKPKVEKKIWIGKFSFLQSEEKEKKKSSTVSLELTIRKMDQPGKALRMKNEFSSTTTASKGPHDYWKAPEWSRQWRSL